MNKLKLFLTELKLLSERYGFIVDSNFIYHGKDCVGESITFTNGNYQVKVYRDDYYEVVQSYDSVPELKVPDYDEAVTLSKSLLDELSEGGINFNL